MILCDGESFAGLELASLNRRWGGRLKGAELSRNGYETRKWFPGCGINSKQVILSPGRSVKVATEYQHLHRIVTWRTTTIAL
ncbi:hypothetical protein TNCV_1120551 [Trichonephila clavipes]|uniref:Uncharacterized protein n=1 Tax=Trichonephila clavipes TaxID=2585209 RepID=A0A8X6SZ38_TRICX|nr:hypothetical protein TNCV_1120551 [Trichonephila clavipes]